MPYADVVWMTCHWLAFSSTGITPFIYFRSNSVFRVSLKRLFSCFKRTRKNQTRVGLYKQASKWYWVFSKRLTYTKAVLATFHEFGNKMFIKHFFYLPYMKRKLPWMKRKANLIFFYIKRQVVSNCQIKTWKIEDCMARHDSSIGFEEHNDGLGWTRKLIDDNRLEHVILEWCIL